MVFLHPVISVLALLLILGSSYEIYTNQEKDNKPLIWGIAIFMVLIGGLRQFVGADYPVYNVMYQYFMQIVDPGEIVNKMLFRPSKEDIEWGYILLNKVLFYFGAPFYVLTLVISIVTIFGRTLFYTKNSPYPVFSLMLFLIPVYFTTDNGHMRQAIAMVICLFSYQFIKSRKLLPFLLCMYLAYAFHKSSVIFLPAYWLVLIPLNRVRMLVLVLLCIALSPFHVYTLLPGLVESLTPQDVSAGYNGYVETQDKASTFMDILMAVNFVFLYLYDKAASSKVWYYEYIRNILFFGICLYFIFRDNPVFATRLVGLYTGFASLVMPTIAYVLPSNNRKIFHAYFVVFFIFYYFVFASFQGRGGSWTPDLYNNYLFLK